MNSIFYFDTRPKFQDVLNSLRDTFSEIVASDKDSFRDVDVTNTRIVAAALQVAYSSSPNDLSHYAQNMDMPYRAYKDKEADSSAVHKTVHLSPLMVDYLKGGASKLNIEVLGPAEDLLHPGKKPEKRIRLGERQYLHVAIYHLHSLSDANISNAIKASYNIHPFKKVGKKISLRYEDSSPPQKKTNHS
ncbi:MAG: hypothetical protein ACPGVT_05350 [Maricaulaceae bacterium]